MANFAPHSFKSKGTKPSTSQVPAHGTSEAKSGTGATNKPFKVDSVPPGGSNMPKKGTGGTLEFGKFKSQAATKIDGHGISAAK